MSGIATKHAPCPWQVVEWKVTDQDGALGTCGLEIADAEGYKVNSCISEADGEQEEENLQFIVLACNAYDGLVAQNAALQEDLDMARSNWERAAEEVLDLDVMLAKERSVRGALVAALIKTLVEAVERYEQAVGEHPGDSDWYQSARAALAEAGKA